MLTLTKYLTDACGKKWVFRIIDLSKSLKNRYTISFKVWYIRKMLDIF